MKSYPEEEVMKQPDEANQLSGVPGSRSMKWQSCSSGFAFPMIAIPENKDVIFKTSPKSDCENAGQ